MIRSYSQGQSPGEGTACGAWCSVGPRGSCVPAAVGLGTGSTCHLTLCPVLQAAGGAAGHHEAQRDGEWPLPVSALWGGARLPGRLVGVLQGLPEGKTLLGPCSSGHPARTSCTAPLWLCILAPRSACVFVCTHVSTWHPMVLGKRGWSLEVEWPDL